MDGPVLIMVCCICYIASVAIVVTRINKFPYSDRNLTNHRWIRIVMAVFAPFVIIGTINLVPVILCMSYLLDAEIGIRRLIAGESTAKYQYPYLSHEHAVDWEEE